MNDTTEPAAAQPAIETCSSCGQSGPASDFVVYDYSHNPEVVKRLPRRVSCKDMHACLCRQEAATSARCKAILDAAVARRLGGAA